MKPRFRFIRSISISSCNWLFLIFVEIALTKGPPPKIISKSQTRHLMRVGESVRLPCAVEESMASAHLPPPIVTWKKDGETIHRGWERYRINEESNALKVKDLETTDSGVFTCEATNGFGSDHVRYLVYVYDVNATSLPPDDFDEDVFESLPGREDPPQFLNPDPMDSLVARRSGDTVRLTCRASGVPKPEVTWYKNGVVLQTTEVNNDVTDRWTLKIVNARTTDSGRYLCKVTNKAGAINFTYTVNVTDRPLRNISAVVGTEASFECQIQSDSTPHVKWLKRLESTDEFHRRKVNSSNTVTLEGSTYAILQETALISSSSSSSSSSREDEEEEEGGSFVSRLTISPVAFHDAGMYICSVATNEGFEGFGYKTAFLSVLPSGSEMSSASSSSSLLDVAFLPAILSIVAVVGIVFFAVVAFVVCRRKICADDKTGADLHHRSSPAEAAAAAAAAAENPSQRLTTAGAGPSVGVLQGGAPHPYQCPSARSNALHQQQQPTTTNLMAAHSREFIARCHPNNYSDYSSIGKTPGVQTSANNKQLLLQQQQQQHYQQQQQTTHQPTAQLQQLHFYENC